MTAFAPPLRFTVSQLRVAAACPRILYFDADDNRRQRRAAPTITRIWEPGGGSTAAGGLFHQAVEKFNQLARTAPEIRRAISQTKTRHELFQELQRFFARQALQRARLAAQPAEVVANFTHCVEVYFGELADIIQFARSGGQSAEQIASELFADLPKRVDVTLHLGPRQQPVQIVGRLDYVFFDRRSARLRILDYKLTPAEQPNKDLFQAAAYALLYQHQHGYQCDAGVLYLHPERRLIELPWEQIHAARHKLYDLLSSMADWVQYDAARADGLKPPGDLTYCEVCRWRRVCTARLGDKADGALHEHARQSGAGAVAGPPAEPLVTTRPPHPEPAPESEQERFSDEPPVDAIGSEETWPAPQPNPPPAEIDTVLRLGRTEDAASAIEIPRQRLSTHTAIVGAAGSGKTWLAKVVAEEAILCGVPVLAIDPQGDLVQFLRPADRERIPPAERSRYDQFVQRVEPRIFTPGTSHGVRLSLSPIRLPSLADLAAVPAARRQEEFDDLVNAVAVHLIGLTLKGKRNVEQQQTFLARVLRNLLPAAGQRSLGLTEIATAVHAPEDCGLPDADLLIRKAERENLGRQLYALAHGPLARLFSGGLGLDIDRLRQPVSPGKTPLNVIYLNALTEPEKHAFLAALATEVYRWMSCTGGDAATPQLLFYLDEARDYLPAGTAQPAAKGPLTRLFTQGRKFGVGCLVCTQSPRSVDYNIFGNCSTKLIGRLETPQDSERVAEWFASAGPKPPWVVARSGAVQGTFVGRWPEQPEELDGAVFRSRVLFSRHEGAWSPERLEAELVGDAVHAALRDEK